MPKEEIEEIRNDSLYLNKLTTKVRCVVARPFIASLLDIGERLNNDGYEYALIEHDKDTDTKGEFKKKHIHIVMIAKKRHRISYYINYLQMICKKTTTNAIEVQPSESYEFDIQYLIHKNDATKYQYETKQILTNLTPKSLDSIMQMELKKTLTYEDLEDIVCNSKTRSEVDKKLGIGKAIAYKSLIDNLVRDCRLGENLRDKGLDNNYHNMNERYGV